MKFVSQQIFIFYFPILAKMKRLIFFVLSLIGSLQINSQNLLINPGFEAWQKINKPEGWTTALSCLKDSLIINSGIYSCRQAATSDSRELGQLIPVFEGYPYKISFWYRNELSGNGCRIWSNWKDADGNSITDDLTLPLLHSGYLKSETWNQYTAEVDAPANASYFNLIIRTLPNSVTYWDDIVFEESAATFRDEIHPDNIMVYPNPATNYLIISNVHYIQFIDILSITGIKMWSQKINGEESLMIPLSVFEDGIYIIYLYSKDIRNHAKFIKTSDY